CPISFCRLPFWSLAWGWLSLSVSPAVFCPGGVPCGCASLTHCGESEAMKLIFGLVITVAAIVVFLLALVVVLGILAGVLAPFLGNVPISYNFRSIRARWTSTIVAIIGIAGTVGVFVAMLSLARGFKATLVASGSPGNVLVMRAGSPSEM